MPPPDAIDPPFNVLFFNTHLFGDSLAIANAFRKLTGQEPIRYKDPERAALLAERLNQLGNTPPALDFVALCEVWDDEYSDRIYDKIKGTYPHQYRPTRIIQAGNDVGSGLVLFSRHPFDYQDFAAYAAESGLAESRSQKGLACVVIQPKEECPVLVMATHLQSGTGKGDQKARRGQLKQMQQIARAMQRDFPAVPHVIGGDFNIIGEDVHGQPTAEYQPLPGALGMRDTFRVVHPNASQALGFTSDATNKLVVFFDRQNLDLQRLDYIFCDPKPAVRVIGCDIEEFKVDPPLNGDGSDTGYLINHLSDHFGLRAQFEILPLA
ncbi:MAG: endonuclease/exonuclease/phosphatase family protein [candidate division Zixibacteria bacterium]|nr:endonuclease/exonuclease/phosphatase family protein [candidate division Zixibacteria bacterium]